MPQTPPLPTDATRERPRHALASVLSGAVRQWVARLGTGARRPNIRRAVEIALNGPPGVPETVLPGGTQCHPMVSKWAPQGSQGRFQEALAPPGTNFDSHNLYPHLYPWLP